MRRDLHREMSVAALYIPVPGAMPIPCTVRPHDKPQDNGQLQGSSGYAKVAKTEDTLVFITDDAPPMFRTNAIVSVGPGEAYLLKFVRPPHGITVTAIVERLKAADTVGLPVP